MVNKLETSVLGRAREVRGHLDDDGWLLFCKLAQVKRYEFNAVLDQGRAVNPITLIRVGAVLAQLGQKTRLSMLDPSTKTVLIDLGLTEGGEIKDYLPQSWNRVSLTKYVCEDEPLTETMRELIGALAQRVRTGEDVPKKPKVDGRKVISLMERLSQALELGRVETPEPMRQSKVVAPEKRARDIERMIGSVTTMLNALSSMVGAQLQPTDVSEHARCDVARAVARILDQFGVTADTLKKLRERRGEGVSPLLATLKHFQQPKP